MIIALQNSTECCLEFIAAAAIEGLMGCLVSSTPAKFLPRSQPADMPVRYPPPLHVMAPTGCSHSLLTAATDTTVNSRSVCHNGPLDPTPLCRFHFSHFPFNPR